MAPRVSRTAGGGLMVTILPYIHHVTLNTGHVRRSYRTEVSDEAIEACRSLIGSPGARLIPGVRGYALVQERPLTRCLTATVRPVEDHVLGAYGPPIVTICVAMHSRCGTARWRWLHASGLGLSTITRGVEDLPTELADQVKHAIAEAGGTIPAVRDTIRSFKP